MTLEKATIALVSDQSSSSLYDVLVERYQDSYDIQLSIVDTDLTDVGDIKRNNHPVTLIIFDQHHEGTHGADYLEESIRAHEDARRILVTEYPTTKEAIISINRRHIHYYMVKPWNDKLFDVIDDLLIDWRSSVQLPFMKVKGVMTLQPVRIRIDASLARAAEIVALSGVGDLMVLDTNGQFAGVLSVGDILRAAMPDVDEIIEEGGSLDQAFQLFIRKGSKLSDKPIQPIVIYSPITVDPEDHVAKVATVLLEKGIGRLPVVKDGRLMGTISRADICQAVVSTYL